MATSCSLRASADPYGEMAARSVVGAECAPTPTWPEGPKIGRRRPARHGLPSDRYQVTDRSSAVLRSAQSTRVALPRSTSSPARRALRALEAVWKVLVGPRGTIRGLAIKHQVRLDSRGLAHRLPVQEMAQRLGI